MVTRFEAMVAIGLLAAVFGAADASAQVTVSEPWARATVPQQKASGAFMRLTATQDSRLVEVRSPAARVVELHEMVMDGNTMRMRAAPGLDLPAGKPFELKPGGYHVMLMDLNQQLKEGDTVPITLVVEHKDKQRETIEVAVPVRAINAAQGSAKP
jgi:periplasmic copper chaperone A